MHVNVAALKRKVDGLCWHSARSTLLLVVRSAIDPGDRAVVGVPRHRVNCEVLDGDSILERENYEDSTDGTIEPYGDNRLRYYTSVNPIRLRAEPSVPSQLRDSHENFAKFRA